MRSRSLGEPQLAGVPHARRGLRVREQLRATAARADRVAVALARAPGVALVVLLAVELSLCALFIAGGLAVNGDQAFMFRELAPATWLSFAQLAFIAACAWAVHTRAGSDPRWTRSFWGIAAMIFLAFAFDEITQSAIFLSHALEDGLGLHAVAGFHDLEAVLLSLAFAAAALVLLPRLPQVLRYPLALVPFGVAVLLGAASQSLDSFAAPTQWEFVAEEVLKLSAEVFFVCGFLVALRVAARRPARPARARDAAAAGA